MDTKTDFQSGVDAMARSCLAAMTLLRDGRQTVGDVEQWLKAVIENDAQYYDKARKAIAAAMLRPKPIHSHLHVDVKRGIITCGEHRSFVAKEIARKIELMLISPNDAHQQPPPTTQK